MGARKPVTTKKEVFVCGDCCAMLRESDARRTWTPLGVRQMQQGELCAFHLAAGAIPCPGSSTWVELKDEDEARRYVGALVQALAKRGPVYGPIDPEDHALVAKLALHVLIAEESLYSAAAIDGAVLVAHKVVRRVKGK